MALDTEGVPRTLGGAADQAAYRILHEALTNATRHGAGSATIALVFGDQAVELVVTNPAVNEGVPRPGGGHGLIGLRERATLLGGSLDVERANGAFRIHARLPYGCDGRAAPVDPAARAVWDLRPYPPPRQRSWLDPIHLGG